MKNGRRFKWVLEPDFSDLPDAVLNDRALEQRRLQSLEEGAAVVVDLGEGFGSLVTKTIGTPARRPDDGKWFVRVATDTGPKGVLLEYVKRK